MFKMKFVYLNEISNLYYETFGRITYICENFHNLFCILVSLESLLRVYYTQNKKFSQIPLICGRNKICGQTDRYRPPYYALILYYS